MNKMIPILVGIGLFISVPIFAQDTTQYILEEYSNLEYDLNSTNVTKPEIYLHLNDLEIKTYIYLEHLEVSIYKLTFLLSYDNYQTNEYKSTAFIVYMVIIKMDNEIIDLGKKYLGPAIKEVVNKTPLQKQI